MTLSLIIIEDFLRGLTTGGGVSFFILKRIKKKFKFYNFRGSRSTRCRASYRARGRNRPGVTRRHGNRHSGDDAPRALVLSQAERGTDQHRLLLHSA